MIAEEELHKEIRDAIFLAALGNWEEMCTFEELSADGKQVYEDYATAAMEIFRREFQKRDAEISKLRADLEGIADTILAATRESREARNGGATVS